MHRQAGLVLGGPCRARAGAALIRTRHLEPGISSVTALASERIDSGAGLSVVYKVQTDVYSSNDGLVPIVVSTEADSGYPEVTDSSDCNGRGHRPSISVADSSVMCGDKKHLTEWTDGDRLI